MCAQRLAAGKPEQALEQCLGSISGLKRVGDRHGTVEQRHRVHGNRCARALLDQPQARPIA